MSFIMMISCHLHFIFYDLVKDSVFLSNEFFKNIILYNEAALELLLFLFWNLQPYWTHLLNSQYRSPPLQSHCRSPLLHSQFRSLHYRRVPSVKTGDDWNSFVFFFSVIQCGRIFKNVPNLKAGNVTYGRLL